MKRSSAKQAWVIRAGWAGVVSAVTLSAGAAFGQMDDTSPEAPLSGPAVKDREVPGVAETFGNTPDAQKRRAVDRIPARVLRHSMMEALGERAPENVRLSDEQRSAIQGHFREFESQVKAYVESNRAELTELRGKIPPEAMNGPAGEIFGRLDGGPDERGPRRGEKRERAQGEGKARRAAAEIPVEVRERLRELAAGAPSVEQVQTKIWSELRPEQQQAVDARLAQFRERMSEHRKQEYVNKRGGQGKPGLEQNRKPGKGRGPEGAGPRRPGADAGPRHGGDRRERMMRAFEQMSPEEQERVLQRLEERRAAAGRGPRGEGEPRRGPRPMPKEPPSPRPESMDAPGSPT